MDDVAASVSRDDFVASSRLQANLSRFCGFLVDLVYQRSFPYGGNLVFDFMCRFLKMAIPGGATKVPFKAGPLFRALNRIVLERLSTTAGDPEEALKITQRILLHQQLIFSPLNNDAEFYAALCHHLFDLLLVGGGTDLRNAALNIWKLLLIDKADVCLAVFVVVACAVWESERGAVRFEA